jgi:hypothetical protein
MPYFTTVFCNVSLSDRIKIIHETSAIPGWIISGTFRFFPELAPFRAGHFQATCKYCASDPRYLPVAKTAQIFSDRDALPCCRDFRQMPIKSLNIDIYKDHTGIDWSW